MAGFSVGFVFDFFVAVSFKYGSDCVSVGSVFFVLGASWAVVEFELYVFEVYGAVWVCELFGDVEDLVFCYHVRFAYCCPTVVRVYVVCRVEFLVHFWYPVFSIAPLALSVWRSFTSSFGGMSGRSAASCAEVHVCSGDSAM